MQAGLGAFAPSAVGAAPPMPPVPTQPGGIAPLPDRLKQLIEESRIVKQINAKRAGEGQQAGAQMAQGLPTVKEQIARALGATPYNFAGGGIVAFADGGGLSAGDLSLEDLQGLDDIVASAEAEAEWERQQREMMGESESGDGSFWEGDIPLVDRIIRQFGGRVPVSRPRPGVEARNRDRGITLPTTATQPFISGTGAAAREVGMPAAAAQPAATQPAATQPAATPAGATQPAATPAARPDGLGDAFNAYRREQEALARLLGGQGTTPEEVLEARRQYDTATSGMLKGEEDALAEMEAAAKANVFNNDEILAGILAGMQGTDRLGETLLGAATGAARGRASQKKAVAEAKKDLNKLRRELAMKQAELQLARKEGDVNRARAAAVEVQKIKVAIEESSLDYQLKSKDAETRRIAAEATRDRPVTGQITPAVRANAIRQAISSVDKAGIEEKLRTNVSYLRASPAEKARMLAAEKVAAVVRQLGAYGVTPDEVAAMYNAPIAGAPTGGGADPLGIR